MTTTQTTTIELYAPQIEHGNVQRSEENVEYEFFGDYPSIEAAVEAAECNGCGIYLTSTPERGKYTGKITVVAGSKAVYESL